jgi:hypothetical protein
MARKKHSAEQIVALLRQIEVELANHKSIGQACKEAGITQQTYYRWRKEYGGLKLEQARRLKDFPVQDDGETSWSRCKPESPGCRYRRMSPHKGA